MRFGILSQWFAPETGSAAVPGVLANALARRGHEVRVVTGFPNYPTGRLAPGYRLRARTDEIVGAAVQVRRVALYPSHDRSPLKRAANYTSFAASASIGGVGLLRDVDAFWVYNSPATVGLPSMLATCAGGPPHLMHVMDLWPDSIAFSGLTSGPALSFVDAVLQRWCKLTYRRAAAIAGISSGIVDVLAERGVPAAKLHHIPVWTDEEVYRPLTVDASLAAEVGVTDAFTVLYAGNLGGAQGLDAVLDVCARVSDLRDLRFLIAGSGTAGDRLQRRAQELRLSNLRFLGRWPAEDMGRLLALGDVHLVTLSRDPLAAVTMPSKLPGLLAAGGAILAWATGEVSRIVNESGAGWVVEPGDVDALEAAVRKIHMLGKSEVARRGAAGLHYYEEHLSLEHGVDQVEALLTTIAEHGGRRRSAS